VPWRWLSDSVLFSVGWRSTSLLVCVLAGCSSAAALQGFGGRCFLATDCKPGLVCVTQPDQTRRCTNDLTAIEGTEDAGVAVTAPPAPARDSGVPVDVGAGSPGGGDGGSSGDDAGGASDGGSGGEGASGDDGALGDDGPGASSGDEASDALAQE
jgi:hypothetical protein